ncbi:Leucine-rich repeat and calponin-likey domain-containing protein 3 [Dirofilaria immitis]|nr:Leucine-rich repeat and calponin-likey domain-containing protein 3 [Dirofilaria immitis]
MIIPNHTGIRQSITETASTWRKRRSGGISATTAPTITPTSIPSTSYQQQSLTRSIDKMFEDAELSGVLLLAGRKLKEFPAHLALKYEISDIISADLSDNRFVHLPLCICEMCSMETLRVRNTGLRSIPSAVQLLQSLTYLDLSGNQLINIPSALFSTPLQILLLTGNRLEYIPREIRQLSNSLRELDASCNKLKSLPADITLLKLLRVLNVRDNQLTHLPSEFSRLELRVLDISQNKLSELPLDLRYMCTLIDFRIDVNPLISPPSKLCSKGREHAFKWLRSHAKRTTDNTTKTYDHTFKQPINVNATLRRGLNIENMNDGRRFERRSRATRFNTVGGSDSGYASTADENRYSRELQSQVGCLFNIDEANQLHQHQYHHQQYQQQQLVSPDWDTVAAISKTLGSKNNSTNPVNNSNGDLLKEVMHAYAQKIAANTTSSNPSELYRLSAYQQQHTTINNELHSHYSIITTTSSTNPCSPTVSFSAQRPQAIVTPMTASVAIKSESKSTDGSKEQNNGIILNLKNNNAFEKEEKNLNNQYCIQCSTANSQRNINNSTKNKTTIGVADHSIIASTQSPKCLSPVVEDSISSGSSSYHIPIIDSVSTIASISSLSGNISVSHVAKNEHILSSSKSTTLTSCSSNQPLSNRIAIDKRNSSSSRLTNLRTTDCVSSLKVKSKLITNTTTRPTHTTLHRSPMNNRTISGTSSSSTSGSVVENMRKVLESRLNITLPSGRLQLAASLADGVTLCNFANRIRLRAVNSLFTPVSKQLPLSPPKCRRNVDSFLTACRRIGVPENSMCSSTDILERRNLPLLAKTVLALNKFSLPKVNVQTTTATTTAAATTTTAKAIITTTTKTKTTTAATMIIPTATVTMTQPHTQTSV